MTDIEHGESPYAVLGVDRYATAAELRRAYRRRQRQTHPDLGGDPARFHAVQLAWERIGTAEARAAYDREAAGAPRRPQSATRADEGARVWTSGMHRGSTGAPSRARSYGHPGGASRQRFLVLLREWAGRGTELADPYDEGLLARAPVEIRQALADALAEEATARILSDLGPSWAVWHDVATADGGAWAHRADVALTDAPKLDHVALGPTGLFIIQSEDWGGPVRVHGYDLLADALPPGQRPVKALAERARIARRWRVTPSGLVIVLPDAALAEDVVLLRRGRGRRPATFAVRRRALAGFLAVGVAGVRRVGDAEFFDTREHLNRVIRFV
ncbi:MAG: J domain-containing protein [Georgenia sp.]